MAEYIEREKYVKLNDIIETLEREWGYEGMREDLYNLPTADVVEVVRCKDCQSYSDFDTTKCKRLEFHFCDEFGIITKESDFCSYGKRKEGAGE